MCLAVLGSAWQAVQHGQEALSCAVEQDQEKLRHLESELADQKAIFTCFQNVFKSWPSS